MGASQSILNLFLNSSSVFAEVSCLLWVNQRPKHFLLQIAKSQLDGSPAWTDSSIALSVALHQLHHFPAAQCQGTGRPPFACAGASSR